MEDKRLKATARLLEVMNTLRRECPWDREQTFDSLRSNTIEETYELADAITDHNMEGIKEELGDLLLHVVFYSKLGEEEGAFDFGDSAGTDGGYGSMQIHNYLQKETVIAFNNFNQKSPDIGIGNNPDAKGHPDWTFSKTGSQYKAAEIYVVGLFDKTVAK